MINEYIMLFRAFMLGLTIAASIYYYSKNFKKSIGYFASIFVVKMGIYLLSPEHKLSILIMWLTLFLFMVVEPKKTLDALYESIGTTVKLLLGTLSFTSTAALLAPQWTEAISFEIAISIWQFVSVLLISYFEVETVRFKHTRKSKLFSVIAFGGIVLFYGGIIPFIEDMNIYRSVYGLFTAILIPAAYIGSVCIAKSDIKHKIWSEAITENHSLLGLFASAIIYVENDDFEGFKDFFYQQMLEPNISKEPIKISGLNNIKVKLIRNQLYFEHKRAEANNININFEIWGRVKDFGISAGDLQKVLSIYFTNAVEASNYVDNPYISLKIIKRDTSVSIELSNKFNPDHQEQSISENHGHGLRIADECLRKHENITNKKHVEGNVFTQKIVIGTEVDWDEIK